MWNGGAAITAGTYTLSARCYNTQAGAYTITGVICYSNAGSSTVNVANDAAGALLTGAITPTSSWVSGTQSATTTIAASHWTNWTVVADGTAVTIQCVMSLHW